MSEVRFQRSEVRICSLFSVLCYLFSFLCFMAHLRDFTPILRLLPFRQINIFTFYNSFLKPHHKECQSAILGFYQPLNTSSLDNDIYTYLPFQRLYLIITKFNTFQLGCQVYFAQNTQFNKNVCKNLGRGRFYICPSLLTSTTYFPNSHKQGITVVRPQFDYNLSSSLEK